MSTNDPFQLSFETVVAASPMLGHRLENRSSIRTRQDTTLLERWQEASTLPLRSAAQQDAFVVAPLDVLVSREQGKAQFHIIELNGTGIGGVSNMPESVVAAVAASLRRVARSCWEPDSVLLLPVSGKECEESPRLNKLIHEKLIFAEAMQAGLADVGGDADIVTLAGLDSGNQGFREGVSTVVIGYIKDFLDACEVTLDGVVTLHGRRVVGAVNDRFCLNLISNITNSAVTTKTDGTEFMLPLCCEESLQVLGITTEELEELCRVATQYVRHAIDEIPRMESRMDAGHQADWSDLPETVRQRMVPLQAA